MRPGELRIVIAEDSATQAAQLRFLLEENGYTVLAGRNGRQALDLVRQHRPDLLITDVIMPEMDGYQLTSEVKADPELRDIPVIMVTSLTSPSDVFRGLHAGADNFVVKPYEEGTLLTRVNYLLSNKALRKVGKLQMGVEIELGGERHFITAERHQILDLLISTYEQAIRLYEELEQRQKDLARSYGTLNALYDITDALNRCRTEAEVIESVSSRMLELPGVHGAWLYLLEDGAYRLAASNRAPDGALAGGAAAADCHCRGAFLDGALTEAANVEGCALLAGGADEAGPAAHAAIPLVSDSGRIGILNVVGANGQPFDEDQIRTLGLVGSQIVAALERARMHERLERTVAERTMALRQEVAERRQAELRAIRSGEEFRRASQTMLAILNASPLAIIAVDGDGHVQSWNPAAERIFGYAEAEVLGRMLPLARQDAEIREEEGFLDIGPGQELRGAEGKQRRKDGTLIDVRASATPLFDPDGALRGTMLVVEDVTERRRIREQLQQAQKMEAIGSLTGGLAHDFNNLLTIITGNLTLFVESGQLADSELAPLNDALEAAWRGAELTRQLLAFARRQPLESRRLNVTEHLARLARLMERTLGDDIRVVTELASEAWPVRADPSQLETAILNLAMNARDAMPDGGTITITTSNLSLSAEDAEMNPGMAPGDYVVIAVADTGGGIAPDNLDRIFEPFFTTKPPGAGTGLGLAMVFGFARQTGGQIKAYSEPGQGTTMRLYLPRHPGEADDARPDHDNGAAIGNETVLVVDDNAAVRVVVLRHLQELGYRTVEAASAEEALAGLRQHPEIALMITDVVMPDMDGVALAQQALAVRPDLAVIYVSGFPGASFTGRRSLPPGSVIVSKPFRKVDLARRLREALARPR